MFRFGRSKTKKEPKDARPKVEVKRKPVKEPSPARGRPVEGPSELEIAKADALRKTHVPTEKGLPSFAEFGTKDMLLYEEDDDEDEPANEPEPTLKGGLMVPGQEDRRGRGRHSAGSGTMYSRTPSPQLMPPSRDPSPMGRAPSPHISPLRERPHSYGQYQHSPQHVTGQNLGSYYQDRPAADPAWRSSSYDPYGPQTAPNSYHQPTSGHTQDYYTSASPHGYDHRASHGGDPYGLAPQMPPYTAPPPLHDPYRQPVHPPTHWNDAQPQYPSPSTERYYNSPSHSHQRAQSYDQPAYYGHTASPAHYPPSHPPPIPHQTGTWGTEAYEDPRARQYASTNAWQNPASGYAPSHHQPFPARQAPSPQPYAHHHRSQTVDSGTPYYNTPPVPPAPSAPNHLPTRASEHQLRSQQWDQRALDQEIRRRTNSLQPDARPRQEEYDLRAQRTGRHSDYAQPDPRNQAAAQPAYGQQQYPQQTNQQVSRANTRRRVESMTSHLERTHIGSPARPTSRHDIARLSIYHTPSDSRSRESFDFSSSSEADVSPSPSPAPRHRQRTSSVVDGRPQSVYPPSDPRTSLQSLPEESYAYNGSGGLRGAGGYPQGYEREGSKQLIDPVRSTPREVTTFEEPSPGPTLQDIRRKATRRYTEAPREVEDRHRARSRHSEVPGTQHYQQDYSDRGREPPQPAEPYSREPSATGYEADYSQVQTNVDRQYSKTPAPHQYSHESDRTSASKPSRDSLMYESQTGSHVVYDEPEESVPAPPPPSRTPAPTTPHRRRTVVLNGPRGPRSPPNHNVLSSNSPAARVSLARA